MNTYSINVHVSLFIGSFVCYAFKKKPKLCILRYNVRSIQKYEYMVHSYSYKFFKENFNIKYLYNFELQADKVVIK